MPLGLINVYSTRNLGDAAILRALTAMSPDGRAFARTPDADPVAVPGLAAVARLPSVSAYVSVGGDIFNNGRPDFVSRRFLANLGELSRHARRTFVFGQSIPRSCRGFGFSLLARAFRRLPCVVVRDEESLRRLAAAGVRAELGHDAAFALEAPADAAARGAALLSAAGIEPSRAALLSMRGFDRMYPMDQAAFMSRMAALAGALAARGHRPVALVQADAEGADSDRAIAAQLAARVPEVVVLDLFQDREDPVSALMCVLAAAETVVAVRYHTAILRLLSGRMPVVLSYSNKTRDLCDRLAIPGQEAADFDPALVARQAERAAARTFDPLPASRLVRDHFARALALAGAR
ncbi:MAG TPA: polysaccharide pyruvyl transferase family protein [Beijerinckiaceae bacterium]|jgi:polysaccharide pyruvyl transferase WcaK-like protein